jgi:signal transduction histidine kinase
LKQFAEQAIESLLVPNDVARNFVPWFRRSSVKRRVTTTATLLLGLSLVVSALLLTTFEKSALLREVDSELNERIAAIALDTATGQLGRGLPQTGRESGIVQAIDASGKVISSTPGLERSPVLNLFAAPLSRPGHRTFRTSINSSPLESWRIAAQRIITTEVKPIDLFVATDLARIDSANARLRRNLLMGIPVLLLGFAWISWLTTRWSLRPVEQLIASVEAMSPADLGQRLPEPKSTDEMAHLVRTMNRLLDRVGETRKRERRFAADASHELRTPITTARLNLEIAQANPTLPVLAQAVDLTLIEVGRLETLSRDLLELNRLDQARVRASATAVDIGALVTTEVEHRRKKLPQMTFEVDVLPGVMVLGVSTLLVRVVRNLLENAERHAQSCISIRVTEHSGSVAVTVHNDGPVIGAADRSRIFEPFTRLDEARSRYDGGSGLGLAIVADVVAAHDGTIAVVDDVRGGASFEFLLPVATEPSLPAAKEPHRSE